MWRWRDVVDSAGVEPFIPATTLIHGGAPLSSPIAAQQRAGIPVSPDVAAPSPSPRPTTIVVPVASTHADAGGKLKVITRLSVI